MMADKLRLMAILAHPDDECLGNGGMLARYASEGIETHLVTATRGERGWFGKESDNPGLGALGKIREAELFAAAEVLGIQSVSFLDYIDGELDAAHPAEAIAKNSRAPAARTARCGCHLWSIWRVWTPGSYRHFTVYHCCDC